SCLATATRPGPARAMICGAVSAAEERRGSPTMVARLSRCSPTASIPANGHQRPAHQISASHRAKSGRSPGVSPPIETRTIPPRRRGQFPG
ncbi:MAG TPA: hypothetical protein VIL85_23675, partial [Thermomicrobiales bacterium]